MVQVKPVPTRGLYVDSKARDVFFNGVRVEVTASSEFGTLECLFKAKGEFRTHQEIWEHLGARVTRNAVGQYVRRLRSKLGPKVIATVQGEGYKIAREYLHD